METTYLIRLNGQPWFKLTLPEGREWPAAAAEVVRGGRPEYAKVEWL